MIKLNKIKKEKQYLRLYLDGEDPVKVHTSIFDKFRQNFGPGGYIERSDLENMINESKQIECDSEAVKHISNMSRTQYQIEKHLSNKDFKDCNVSKTIEKLKEKGFIDDQKYIANYIELRINRKGPQLLKKELLQKGVEHDMLQKTLNSYTKEFDNSMKKLGTKHIDKNSGKSNIKHKVFQHLVNKGFSADKVREFVFNIGDINP